MPSTVGLPSQRTDAEVITTAAQLEYDCVAAYGEAAKKAHHSGNAEDFATMASDCARHLQRWQDRLAGLGAAPATPAWSEKPNRWKVSPASLAGDWGIVQVVRNNSADSCEAYERVRSRTDLEPETLEIAAELLGDAQRHRELIAHMPHKGKEAHKGAATPVQSRRAH